jgi:phosphoglycolate phosphatase-like HAD superfamily hydrolase
MTRLLLWDVDGTLIHGGGVAGAAMRAAMERVYGRSSTQERVSYAGKTDQQIVLETFADRPADEVLSRIVAFGDAYLAELTAQREAFLSRASVLAGVVAVLERLCRADTLVLGLLTGNLRPIAQLKLDMVALSPFFDFEASAFGSDHFRRAELVPIAAARAARRYQRHFTGRDIVVIGDTPHDIDCGRAGGARTVAVATGPFTTDDLRTHQPDALLADLADTSATIAAILGP